MHTKLHQETRPDSRLIRRRLFIMKEVVLKALATPPPEFVAQLMQRSSDDERSKFVDQFASLFASRQHLLRTAGVWDEMSEDERLFMETSVLETTQQQQMDASWLAEAIMCLLWSLGHVNHFPKYDEATSPEFVKTETSVEAMALLKQASIRPLEELTSQRDLAEVWNWRCRTRRLLESNAIPETLEDGTRIANVIAQAAAAVAREHGFDSSIGDDFPAFGLPFRDLSREQFLLVSSISQERHRALNWVYGFAPGNRWDETPTET